MSQQIKKGVILSYIHILALNIVSILFTPYLLKSLGKSEYGLYVLIGSFVGYLAVLDFGFTNTITRYVAKYRTENDKKGQENFLATTFVLYFIISILLIVIGAAAYQNIHVFFSNSLTVDELLRAKTMFIILLINLGISFPLNSFQAIIQGYEVFAAPKVMIILRIIIRTGILFLLLWLGYKALSIVILDTVLNAFVMVMMIFYAYGKLKIRVQWHRFDKELLREIFVYSLFIFINMVVDQIYWRLGQVILGMYTSTAVVAVYAVGIQFVYYYMQFSVAISGVFLPRATQMTVQNATGEEMTDLMIKTGRIQLISLGCILSGCILFGRDFITLWVGPGYLMAWQIAVLIMIPLTVPLFQNIGISILQAKNMHGVRSIIYIFVALINIGVSILLVKKYGSMGVAGAIAMSLFAGNIIAINLYYHFKVGLNILRFFKEIQKGLVPAILLSLLGGAALMLISGLSWPVLVGKMILFIFLYAALLWFVGMNQYEKDLIIKPVRYLFIRKVNQSASKGEDVNSAEAVDKPSMMVVKKKCCSCGACSNICPHQSILMKDDEEGFLYPHIIKSRCKHCGLCKKVCPVINKPKRDIILDNPYIYAAWNKEEGVRDKSSSGGIFSALSKSILQKGGIIYGAGFDKTNQLIHMSVCREEESNALRGSKYVQSSTGNTYRSVKDDLNKGRLVLFTGTPCQVSGLYAYLKREYQNLITCDVICHGVPSRKVFSKYLRFIEDKYKKNIESISFRDKCSGWKRFSTTVHFNDRTKVTQYNDRNPYMHGFLKNIFLHPHCYGCQFNALPRSADISLGDFWGIQKFYPELDDDKGISLVIVNSRKGLKLYNKAKGSLRSHQATIEEAASYNPCLKRPCKEPDERKDFFQDLNTMEFRKVLKKYMNPPSGLAYMYRLFLVYLKAGTRKLIRIIRKP